MSPRSRAQRSNVQSNQLGPWSHQRYFSKRCRAWGQHKTQYRRRWSKPRVDTMGAVQHHVGRHSVWTAGGRAVWMGTRRALLRQSAWSTWNESHFTHQFVQTLWNHNMSYDVARLHMQHLHDERGIRQRPLMRWDESMRLGHVACFGLLISTFLILGWTLITVRGFGDVRVARLE